MTDTQLVTIAITLVAILIAMLVNNQRMSDLRTDVGLRIGDVGTRFEQRFADIDKRFGDMDKRFGDVDKRFADFNQRFLDMNRHIDDMATMLRAEMRADRAETNAKLDSILALMANVDQRVTRLEDRPR